MERLQWGAYWKTTRHNEHERYKVKHLNDSGKWELMITHWDLDFIRDWLCDRGVLRKEELGNSKTDKQKDLHNQV